MIQVHGAHESRTRRSITLLGKSKSGWRNTFCARVSLLPRGNYIGKTPWKDMCKIFPEKASQNGTHKASEAGPEMNRSFQQHCCHWLLEKWQALFDQHGGIPPEHIWNMDEKGIQLGGGHKNSGKKFLYFQKSKECYQISSDNLELVTVLKCISAAGGEIPPFFVLTDGPVPDLRSQDDNSWGR